MIKNMGKINLFDISVLLLIISTFAFKDFPIFGYISSFISFLFVILPTIKSKKLDKRVALFIILKLIFIFFSLSSIIWSLNKSIVIDIVIRLLHRFIISLTIILYTDTKEKFKKVVFYMIVASLILCIRMIIEVPIEAWGFERVGKYLSYDEENTYGNTGITYVLGIVGVYLLSSPKSIFKNNFFKYLLVTIFSVFSLLTGSKKQILFLLISFPLLYILKSKNKKEFFRNASFMFFLVLLVFIVVFKVDIFYNAIGERMLQFISYFIKGINFQTDPSTISRINFLKDSWNVFLNNPILGIGLGGYQYVNSTEFVWAENTFLELLADIGIIGFILYYIIHFSIFKSLINRFKYKNDFDIQMIVILISIIIVDLTMVSYYHTILQFYLALLFAENNFILKERKMFYEK